MLAYIGNHFLALAGLGAAAFAVTLLGASIQDALYRARTR